MKKIEFVYREILFQVLEGKERVFTQKRLAQQLNLSLANVNHALKPLKRMQAVKVNPRNFKVVNAKKILYYWACIRNIKKDLIYATRTDLPVKEIEKKVPAEIIFTVYSAYKFKFKDIPADYSEVYVYASDLGEIKKRFPASKKTPNFFVLEKDELMPRYGSLATLAQIYVDLWNLPEWYARDFLKALEEKINGILA